MNAGHKDDPTGRGPGTTPPQRPLSGTMPRIRPVTGGGAVVGQPMRPPTSSFPGLEPAPGSRRGTPRAAYAAPVRVVSGPRTFDGRIDAIGEIDMIVVVPTGLADGERINARFSLPMSQKVVSIPAGVASREPRPGGQEAVVLAFSIVDETFRRELEGYVRLMQR